MALRKGYLLKLKPGALEQYMHWHDNIWPELQKEIADQGIAEITLWNLRDMVILTSVVKDEGSWTRLWDSEIHKKWADIMNPLMHYRPDNVVDSEEITEIWHFEPGKGA